MSEAERELKALEAALSGLTPSPGRLDRDCVLFRAGQRAARRSRLWPVATAALALLSAGLSVALVSRPGPAVVERIVYVPTPPPVEPGPEPSPVEEPPSWPGKPRYYQIRDEVLDRGLDALPVPPPPGSRSLPGDAFNFFSHP